MSPRTYLVAAGEALYGARWQSALAADLSVSDRTMRRWLAGSSPVPETVRADLRELLAARGVRIRELLAA